MLSLEKFSFNIDDKINLDGLSVTLLQTSVTNIIGKQDLLQKFFKQLLSLNSNNLGKISIHNNDIKFTHKNYLNDINYIGTNAGLKKDLTVFENLTYWSSIYQTEILVETAISYLQLGNILGTKISELSKADYCKFKLFRLIIRPTPIWYLYQPFKNLEPAYKEKLQNMIEVRAREGGIVILATDEENLKVINNQINLNYFTHESS
ncbi:MAG: hypothetical protein ISQ32_05035 [Rickettsiales bacterium]|nr:hypothetical protein [Rickettsiales bacterium]